MLDKLFKYILKSSPHLLELLSRLLQHCSAVKLQKYFGDYELWTTLPNFLSALD